MSFAFAFGMPGPFEMAVIAVIAVLLFGSRLPSVARSFGQSFWALKKGLAEGEAEVAEIKGGMEKGATEASNAVKDAVSKDASKATA